MNVYSVLNTGALTCAKLTLAITFYIAIISTAFADQTSLANKTQSTRKEHNEGVVFTPEQMVLANIEVTRLEAKILPRVIYAPGEIKANGYTSYVVSPRTESVVVSRHAILGEHVEKNQVLVTLFSESVAEAQANYRVAYSEWQRVNKLTQASISDSQRLKSEVNFHATSSRLSALGLTQTAIDEVITKNESVLGEYQLVAKRSGVVLSDDFSQGQRVAAGDNIMVLADEKNLWVEAKISPNKKMNLPVGTMAKVEYANQFFTAKVIQEAHTIDPVTRTRIVRLAVENSDDTLHSGMFVDVHFQNESHEPVMAVPESALMRSADGGWTVFVEEHSGEFKAVEVKVGQAFGSFRQIHGVAANTRVVMSGAFFVASEIAKTGFDPHNH